MARRFLAVSMYLSIFFFLEGGSVCAADILRVPLYERINPLGEITLSWSPPSSTLPSPVMTLGLVFYPPYSPGVGATHSGEPVVEILSNPPPHRDAFSVALRYTDQHFLIGYILDQAVTHPVDVALTLGLKYDATDQKWKITAPQVYQNFGKLEDRLSGSLGGANWPRNSLLDPSATILDQPGFDSFCNYLTSLIQIPEKRPLRIEQGKALVRRAGSWINSISTLPPELLESIEALKEQIKRQYLNGGFELKEPNSFKLQFTINVRKLSLNAASNGEVYLVIFEQNPNKSVRPVPMVPKNLKEYYFLLDKNGNEPDCKSALLGP